MPCGATITDRIVAGPYVLDYHHGCSAHLDATYFDRAETPVDLHRVIGLDHKRPCDLTCVYILTVVDLGTRNAASRVADILVSHPQNHRASHYRIMPRYQDRPRCRDLATGSAGPATRGQGPGARGLGGQLTHLWHHLSKS